MIGERRMFLGGLSMGVVVVGVIAVCLPNQALADPCVLDPEHAGLTFPVEKIDPLWTCKLQSVIGNYTTANKVGPMRAALSESMYEYLLDRPPLAAALINRLDLALYKAEFRGHGRYWGNDGEGTEGIIDLVYRDRDSRIYFVEGTHESRLLPNMSGQAVLFLRMRVLHESAGVEAMESTMVSYVRLNNRIVAGLLSLLRPLIGGTVTRKLAKGVEVVNRLGREMRDHPERVLFEANDPPSFAVEDIAFLTEALGEGKHPRPSVPTRTVNP